MRFSFASCKSDKPLSSASLWLINQTRVRVEPRARGYLSATVRKPNTFCCARQAQLSQSVNIGQTELDGLSGMTGWQDDEVQGKQTLNKCNVMGGTSNRKPSTINLSIRLSYKCASCSKQDTQLEIIWCIYRWFSRNVTSN